MKERSFGCPDATNKKGQFVKSISSSSGAKIWTISGGRWNSMSARCNPASFHSTRRPSYRGCVNGFSDFQEFASWSVNQFGYDMRNNNGTLYHLDKDLLIIGNSTYSTDTCLFVPSRINNLTLSSRNRRGDLPVGVTKNENQRCYRARCNSDGKAIGLGSYFYPLDAHRAWQEFKVEEIMRVANEEFSVGRIDDRIFNALVNYSLVIAADMNLGQETTLGRSRDASK